MVFLARMLLPARWMSMTELRRVDQEEDSLFLYKVEKESGRDLAPAPLSCVHHHPRHLEGRKIMMMMPKLSIFQSIPLLRLGL